MGLFDSVYFTCPRCDKKQEAQSKTGFDPYLNNYPVDAVPVDVAADLIGAEFTCNGCQHLWLIAQVSYPKTVALRLVEP